MQAKYITESRNDVTLTKAAVCSRKLNNVSVKVFFPVVMVKNI